MAKSKKTNAKPAKAKPTARTKPAETARTRAPTISKLEETAQSRAKTAKDIGIQSPRTRAPTKSEREENPRTKAPTIRPGALADTSRTRRDTLREPLRPDAAVDPSDLDTATTGRWQRDTVLEVAPTRSRTTTMKDRVIVGDPHDEVTGVTESDPSDPARVLELASLESRIDTLEDPEVLVAVASQIDKLGMQLAFEISRHAHDADHVAPLKPVLMRVPTVYGRALVRAAEKYDDRGSPKRAAYVLFEALRKAFDPALIASMCDALAFILEAHQQGPVSFKLRDLVRVRAEQRASGMDRKDVRTQFATALTELRDHGIDWNALVDDDVQFD